MTDPAPPFTFFDSPQRSPQAAIEQTARDIASSPIVAAMLEGFPSAAVLLDANRQVVALNTRASAMFEAMTPFDVQGLRLGEAVGCVCSESADGGCGTRPACAECGAAHALRQARESRGQAMRECRIVATGNGRQMAFDLRVLATPVQIAQHDLLLVAIEDIENEKRRYALERIFFHDVLGTGNAVHGLAKMIAGADPARVKEVAPALVRASGQMLEEIQAQRDLLLAERGELTIKREAVRVRDILRAVHEQYFFSPLAEGRQLISEPYEPEATTVRTDATQLVRSLGNLVRNALEATSEGERVAVSAEPMSDGIVFHVSNPGSIPRNLQLQIFQRSFSTKAARGRGIGTYSVKLIVEQYLDGRVSFVSSAETGTVFSIWLPLL